MTDTRDFRTPHGHRAAMTFRPDTSDWNTLYACLNEDEYGFRGHAVTGTAVDVGAHIGGVTVGLAIDNPELRVIAVEPVPENAALLRQNIEQNGIADRVTVIEGAAGGKKAVDVWYGYRGDEVMEHHAWIGNSSLAYARASDIAHETVHYPKPVRLSDLGPLSLIKIDCEGGEYAFLADPAVRDVPLILGEWHPVMGNTIGDFQALLADSHVVTFSGPQTGPGGFVAVAK